MKDVEQTVYGILVEENNKYNFKTNNGSLLCEKWFDIYRMDKTKKRVIIGYLKSDKESFPNQYDEYIYGGINKGKLTVKPIYDYLLFGTEDTFISYEGNKAGYVDSTLGIEITPIIFDIVGLFENGKAYVELGDKKGYIGRNQFRIATSNGIVYRFNINEVFENEKVFSLK